MAQTKQLRQLDPDSGVDTLVPYITDVQPVWEANREWLGKHHADKDRFVVQVLNAGSTVLVQSAKAIKESLEAKLATQTQDESIDRGRAVAMAVRERGAFIARELSDSNDTAKLLEAKQVQAACGVGKKVELRRQTGVRKLLLVQNEGLPKIKTILETWNQPADLHPQVQASIKDIDKALRSQSKEQLEADAALSELSVMAKDAVTQFNRALRLVNLERARAPAELLQSLESLQGDHPECYRNDAKPETPSEEDPAVLDPATQVS